MNPITKNPALENHADLATVFYGIYSTTIVSVFLYGLIRPQKRLLCLAWAYIFLILGPTIEQLIK